MNTKQANDLVLQALEHERGGEQVYATALKCVRNEDLADQWKKYLKETKQHQKRLTAVCAAFGLDPEQETPSRAVVRNLGKSLVAAMLQALDTDPAAAQLVACECVVLAETKDHANWQLLGKVAEGLEGPAKDALQSAYDEVEDQEDEHLYQSKGWCRELWIDALGLPAVLPPPEETRAVKTAIGQARAEQAADLMRT